MFYVSFKLDIRERFEKIEFSRILVKKKKSPINE